MSREVVISAKLSRRVIGPHGKGRLNYVGIVSLNRFKVYSITMVTTVGVLVVYANGGTTETVGD